MKRESFFLLLLSHFILFVAARRSQVYTLTNRVVTVSCLFRVTVSYIFFSLFLLFEGMHISCPAPPCPTPFVVNFCCFLFLFLFSISSSYPSVTFPIASCCLPNVLEVVARYIKPAMI